MELVEEVEIVAVGRLAAGDASGLCKKTEGNWLYLAKQCMMLQR